MEAGSQPFAWFQGTHLPTPLGYKKGKAERVLGERLLGRCWEAGLAAVIQAAVGPDVSLCCGAFSRRRAKSAALCSEIQKGNAPHLVVSRLASLSTATGLGVESGQPEPSPRPASLNEPEESCK